MCRRRRSACLGLAALLFASGGCRTDVFRMATIESPDRQILVDWYQEAGGGGSGLVPG